MTVHAGYKPDFRDAWFVVFNPPEDDDSAALVAVETEPNEWEGFWTYRPGLVADVNDHIARRL